MNRIQLFVAYLWALLMGSALGAGVFTFFAVKFDRPILWLGTAVMIVLGATLAKIIDLLEGQQ